MTISNTGRTAGPFIGNGITKNFPFSYKVFSQSDVLVAVTVTSTGVESLLTLDADYTVQMNANQNANPGGVINLVNALPVGSTLAATSNVSIVQSLDLTNGSGFYPDVINTALDRVVVMIQQLNARVGLGALNVGAAAQIAKVLGFIDKVASSVGAALIGFIQAGVGAVLRTIQDELRERVSVTQFGAVGDGVTSDSLAWQRALDYAHSIGGARVNVPNPKVAWVLDFPVFVHDNTELVGTGAGCRVIVKNPTYAKGRGGIVIGSSLEANRTLALAAYADGTYKNQPSIRNSSYVNPALKQYLRDNPQFTEAKNSTVRGFYLVAQFDNPADWGGYAINLVNAWNCHVQDIWGEGWTQLVGMGSDVAPETPSTYLCTARNLHVVKPDLVHTYYSIGFIANSTNCEISDAWQHQAIPDGTTDGNGVAAAYSEECVIRSISIPNLGLTANSQGVLLNSCEGCVVDEIHIGHAKTAVGTYFLDSTYNDPAKRNKLGPTISGDTCTYVLSLGAKFAVVLGYVNVNSTYDVGFLNSDSTNNVVYGPNNSIYTPNDQARRLYLINNTLQHWQIKSAYFRPADLLVNDKFTDALSYDLQKSVKAKAGVPLYFLWPVPSHVRAIDSVAAFLTYADNAQAAGTSTKIEVRRMVQFDGNTSEVPYVEATATDVANNAATVDKQYAISNLLIEQADTSHGLANSLDVLLSLLAPTQFSTVKEIRITYYE